MKAEEYIFTVVEGFYQKAKVDILIGYHFRHIQNFDEHIPRIVAFWEIQLLGATSKPLIDPFDLKNVHLPLGIKPGELGRWLLLFRTTLNLENEKHPEFEALKNNWIGKLDFFEGVFLRFLGF